jgi:DNA-directed RNA polymerase sigma subunit (sigma70/sigma32)
MKEFDYSRDDQDPDQMTDLVGGGYNLSPDIEDLSAGFEPDAQYENIAESRRSSDHMNDDPTSELVISQDSKQRLELAIKEILDMLHPREAGILRARFGLGGEKMKILEEISSEFGVTIERIKRMESKFASKLRSANHLNALGEFLEEKDI